MKLLLNLSKLSILVILLISIESKAQTITIGTGTATNNYNEPSPVNVTNRRNVSHTVYTVAELNAAGITGPKAINRMGYFITNIPTLTMNGYTIRMKHTNAANAAGNVGDNGYTTVKNAFNYSPNQGVFDMLDLDVPFVWNGVQNIAVRICWATQNQGNPSGQLRTFASTNGFRYRVSGNGGNSYCGSGPNTNRNWKPQIRFVFDTETIWTGAVSSDWALAANWSSGVPNETMDTRIPTGTPNTCTLNGAGSTALLTIEGELILNGTGRLNVFGNLINTGTFTDNGGETSLTGDGPNTLNSSTPITISNLIVDSKFGGTVVGSDLTISNELQVNKSTLNTNNLIIIKSDAAGTARINELTTNCFYELEMFDAWGDGWNGGTLTVLEDGVPIGTYQAYYATTTEIVPVNSGSLIELVYAPGIFENENSYNFKDPNGTTIFSDGPNPTVGNVFSTTSTCGFTDPISGEISAERYIDAGETFWRYLGSAVQGATIEQFNDDFATSGYPGSWYPNFGWTSVYSYDETAGPGAGYVPASGISDVMLTGQGWQVWSGDTSTGTQPFTIDLKGVPNQGDINMPVTYTASGTPTEDGFNLVANPYASTIDWDDPAWVKTNMANATYIQNPDNQQYATYVSGASTNGGSRYIASQQSFWVQAFGASPVLTAREGVKASNDQQFLKTGSVASPGMTITLQGNAEFDEAILRHIDGAVDDFEYQWDAEKWWGGWGQYPQVSLINDQQKDLTVHSFDKGTQEFSIPLRAIVFTNGMYNMEFNNISEMDVPCMQLEDTYTGQSYLIEEGSAFAFEMFDTTYTPRFIIHVGKQYNMISNPLSCNSSADGEVILDLDINQDVNYNLTLNGQSASGLGNGDPLIISNLNSGIYSIEIPSLVNSCNQTVFNVVVNEPAPIVSNAQITDEILGSDGSIFVQPSGGSAPYSIYWSSGDNEPNLTNLVAGTYDITIVDADGCEIIESYTINSQLGIGDITSDAELFYNAEQNLIQLSGFDFEETTIFNLYSSDGKLIESYSVQPDSETYFLNLPKGLSKGIYFIGSDLVSYKFSK